MTCDLCGATVSNEEILDHLRVLHPDQYDEPEFWPDGRPAYVDRTLKPADFDEGEGSGRPA